MYLITAGWKRRTSAPLATGAGAKRSLDRLGIAALMVVWLTGCGFIDGLTGPGPRPQVPQGDPWPLNAEAAVERLEVLGYVCIYEPDSDIPGGWHCTANGSNVSIDSDETGPILGVFAYMFEEEEPPPNPDVMDARATSWINDELLPALVPEDVVPSDEVMLAMVQKNWPAEIGDGWIVGFDRSSNQRTLHVRFVEPDD